MYTYRKKYFSNQHVIIIRYNKPYVGFSKHNSLLKQLTFVAYFQYLQLTKPQNPLSLSSVQGFQISRLAITILKVYSYVNHEAGYT